MALMQSLSTGITGLMSHQTAMDNLGNNLANINTIGYKKGVHQFATLLEQTMRGGMAASGGRGSVNPMGMGMGTLSASISKVFAQGELEPTGSFNDIANLGRKKFFGITRFERGDTIIEVAFENGRDVVDVGLFDAPVFQKVERAAPQYRD